MTFDAASLSVARRRRLTLLAMCLSQFMILLDLTIVNVALPSMQRELRLSPGSLEWVISAYALSLAALIPFGGALGDRFGRKRVFLAGMIVFVLGSVGCALAGGDTVLIAARAVQGAGGAAMSALTLSILAETFPGEGRAHAIGTWASIGGLGFGAGPVAGGVLLSFSGWSSVFWVNLPIGAAGLALAAVSVTESAGRRSRRLDIPGLVTSALGLTGVTLGLIESSSRSWGAVPVAVPLAAGVVLLAGFTVWEHHAAAPMVPPALLRARSFTAASLVNLLSTVGVTGAMFYLTLLYQDVHGWSVLRTGLSWLLMNIPYLVMARLSGRLHRRFSSAAIVGAGCLVAGISVLLLSSLGASTPFAVAAAGYILWGIGFGTSSPGISHAAMRDVPSAVSGAASGVLNAARQVGSSVGLAVLGSIGVSAAASDWAGRVAGFPAPVRAAASGQAQNVAGARIVVVARALGPLYRDPAAQSFVHGYHLAVAVGGACLLAAAALAAVGLRTPRGSHQPPAAAAEPPASALPAQDSPSPAGRE